MGKILQIESRGSPHKTHYLSAGKMAMFAQFTVKCFEEYFVGDFADVHAGVIQDGDDALVLLLHEVHDDLVIEVIDLQDTARKQFQRERRLAQAKRGCLPTSREFR